MLEICWCFSEFLEAVAILPQLVLLQRTKNIDNLTANYVFALGWEMMMMIMMMMMMMMILPITIPMALA